MNEVIILLEKLLSENPRQRELGRRKLIRFKNPAAFDILLNALSHQNLIVRKTACYPLGNIGDNRAVEPLLAFLEDKSSRIASPPIIALGKIGDKRAVNSLIPMMNHPKHWIRRHTIEALENLSDKRAVPHITERLQDSHLKVRLAAAKALGNLGDIQSVPALIETLGDEYFLVADAVTKVNDGHANHWYSVLERYKNAELRAEAAKSLGKLKAVEAIPALISSLDTWGSIVISSVVIALGQIGNEQTIEPLFSLLLQKASDGKYQPEWVLASVVKALQTIGTPKALSIVDELIELLSSEDVEIRSHVAYLLAEFGNPIVLKPLIEDMKNPNLDTIYRVRAALSLGVLKNTQAVEPLIEMLIQYRDTRAPDNIANASAISLGHIGDKRAIVPLRETLSNVENNIWVRARSAESLGSMNDVGSIDLLITFLKDRAPDVRKEAATALGKMKHPKDIVHLKALLDDWLVWVRNAAEEALRDIGTDESLNAIDEWWYQRKS